MAALTRTTRRTDSDRSRPRRQKRGTPRRPPRRVECLPSSDRSDVTLSVTLIPDEAFFARPWNSSTRFGSDVTLSVTLIPNTGRVHRTQGRGKHTRTG